MNKILACMSGLLVLVVGTWGQSPSTTVLIGAGGTFALPVYTRWFDEYQKLYPNLQLHYLAVGSGEGVRKVTSGVVDFGGTDLPMTDQEMAASKVKVLHFPTVLGAVVPVYNLPGLEKPLNLTPRVLAGIFLGTILKWNHPAIAAINSDVTLPSNEIVVVHRMEPSGTTYVWTDYLSKVDLKWRTQVGRGAEVKWRTGIAARGNGGVVDAVQRNIYSIGYCELTYAVQNTVSYGLVQNAAGKFIRADSKSVTAAADRVAFRIPDDFRISITNAAGINAYPISTFTWLLVPAKIEGDKKPILKDLVHWMLTSGQDSQLESLGYAGLPDMIVQKELEALEKIE
ncbi:MAG: phosphate ABC transporter substrate-binding protein PstS [Terriglobales bacterium]